MKTVESIRCIITTVVTTNRTAGKIRDTWLVFVLGYDSRLHWSNTQSSTNFGSHSGPHQPGLHSPLVPWPPLTSGLLASSPSLPLPSSSTGGDLLLLSGSPPGGDRTALHPGSATHLQTGLTVYAFNSLVPKHVRSNGSGLLTWCVLGLESSFFYLTDQSLYVILSYLNISTSSRKAMLGDKRYITAPFSNECQTQMHITNYILHITYYTFHRFIYGTKNK